MNKKISVIIISILLAAAVIFGGISYYLNRPYMVVARAFAAKGGRSITGTLNFKLNFDTSKVMSLPEFQSNPFAAAEVAAVKTAFESADVKLDFNGTTDGSQKLLLNGNASLPAVLGNSQNFGLYVDGKDIWSRSGEGSWTKAQNTGTSQDAMKINQKNLMDFIKRCPVAANGNTITITVNPTVEDIKSIIPADTINEINKNAKDGLTFEQVMDAMKISMNLTINKNSKFFIPVPYVSKSDMTITGDLSKLVSSSANMQEDQKAIIEGISFTAKGSAETQPKAGLSVEKPSDIK